MPWQSDWTLWPYNTAIGIPTGPHVRSLGMTCCHPLIPVLSRAGAESVGERLSDCPRPETRLLAGIILSLL